MASSSTFLHLGLFLVSIVSLISGTAIDYSLTFTQLPPPVVIAERNAPLWLPCEAVSSLGDRVSISWQKDFELIQPDQRREVFPNGTLFIAKVVEKKRFSDEGVYVCVATNRNGTRISSPAQLRIANLSHFHSSPAPSTVTRGQWVTLSCLIEGIPTPSIRWQKNKLPIEQTTSKRFHFLPSGILQIENATTEDSGMYRCQATNQPTNRFRYSDEGELTVSPDVIPVAARITHGPVSAVASPGDSVTLHCAAMGFPVPTISWNTPDDQPVVASENVRLAGQGSLLITNITADMAGSYTCDVKQEGMRGMLKAAAQITIVVPPSVNLLVMGLATELESKPVHHTLATRVFRLTCLMEGTPLLNVTWLHDGSPILSYSRFAVEGNRLRIQPTTPSDSGFIQCMANNRAGYALATIELMVTLADGTPSPPANLRAEAVSSTSVRLTFDRPLDPFVMVYTYHYMKTADGKERQEVLYDNTQLFENLSPFTNYSFYVIAYGELGGSDPSDIVTVETKEDVPKVAPVATVTSAGATALSVDWPSLTTSEACGIVTHYQIWSRVSDQQDSSQVRMRATSRNHYVITGLKPDTLYNVRVLAETAVGAPNLDEGHWPWQEAKTQVHPGNVPEPPVITLQVLSMSSLIVSWHTPPGAPSIASSYIISYGHDDTTSNMKKLTLQAAQNSAILNQLDPGTWYIVTVTAVNSQGQSASALDWIRTLPLEDEKLLNATLSPLLHDLTAAPLSDTAIRIQWRPLQVNVLYRLEIWPYNGDHRLKKFYSTNSTNIVVSEMQPFTQYEINVASFEGNKVSASARIFCRTSEGVPSAPLYPNAVLEQPNTVYLTWRPPKRRNGVIVSYIILYSIDDFDDKLSWREQQANGSSTATYVNDLQTDTTYYFKLRAKTRAGPGPPSEVLHVGTKILVENDAALSPGPLLKERDMGILMGILIGGSCIIICVMVILLRNRCFPLTAPHGQADPSVLSPMMQEGFPQQATVAASPTANMEPLLNGTASREVLEIPDASSRRHQAAPPNVPCSHHPVLTQI